MTHILPLCRPRPAAFVRATSRAWLPLLLAVPAGAAVAAARSAPASISGSSARRGVAADSTGTIRYTVRPVPAGDRTNLDVTVHFVPDSAGAVTVHLTDDIYYGHVPRVWRFITRFEGLLGTAVAPGTTEVERTVRPGPSGAIDLRYVLSYDPKETASASFAANVSGGNFHVAGTQWMLQIGKADRPRRTIIDVVDVPPGWHIYSSLTEHADHVDTVASFESLMTAMLGGVSQGYRRFEIQGRPLSVYVQGHFDIPTRDLLSDAGRIVELQRRTFGDYDFPFFNVLILERLNNVAGTAVPNAFVDFIYPQATRAEVSLGIAHEMFHTWLPLKIRFAPDSNEERNRWIHEGFTQYTARLMLLQAGIVSKQQFVDWFNGDLYDLADHPHRTAPYAELSAAANGGGYSQAWMKLSYYRGALIALNWEAAMRAAGGKHTIIELLQALFRQTEHGRRALGDDEIIATMRTFGIDFVDELQRYTLRAEPIVPRRDAMGPGYTLCDTTTAAFDPGFSVDQSMRTRKVTGVVAGGAAERAGLRDGMVVARMRNFSRFGNTWTARDPLTVVIREGGEERSIAFFPRGAPLSFQVYCPVRRQRRVGSVTL